MTLTAYSIPRFGGLNLVDDPEEVGAAQAIDLLNIDFEKQGQGQGRLRSRDGYTNFTQTPDATHEYDSISAFYKINGTKQILVAKRDDGSDARFAAYDSSGVFIANQVIATDDVVDTDFCRFGGPGAEVVYIACWEDTTRTFGRFDTYKWNGTVFTATDLRIGGVGNVSPFALELKAGENRLVGAYHSANNSRVGFSDPGVPETFTAGNYVDLTPGDGERITALCSWREMVFAFKETKFFVFTETSAGSTGAPIFNYRPIFSGVGTIGRACAVSSPSGVYFLSRRGIYLTNGGDPGLISRAIDPIFQGGLTYSLNFAAIDVCSLHWHKERLYFSYPSGSATENDRVLVYDPKNDYWTMWNLPARKMCTFRPDDDQELMFSYSTGLNHIGKSSPAYSTDAGVAIPAHYQSGFYQLNPGGKATTRWSKLWGVGTPTFNIFTDHATSDPLLRGGTVTLGTSPAVDKGFHLKSYQGELFSHKISSTSGEWSLSRVEHDIAQTENP